MTWLDGRDRGGRRTRRSGTNWLTLGALLLGLAGAAATSWAQGDAEMKVGLTGDAGSLDPMKDSSVVGTQLMGHIFDPLVDFRGADLPADAARGRALGEPRPHHVAVSHPEGHQVPRRKGSDGERREVLVRPGPGVAERQAEGRQHHGREDPGPHTVEMKTTGPGAVAPRQHRVRVHRAEGGLPGAGRRGVRSKADRLGCLPAGAAGDKGQRIVLAAFDGYWGGKKSPARIVLRPIPEGSTRLAELLTGGVDLIQDLPVENVKQVRDTKDLVVVQAKGIRAIPFPFNSKADTPLKDKRVRQAINLGDRPRDDRARRPPGLRRGAHRAVRARAVRLQRRGGEDPRVQPGEGQGAAARRPATPTASTSPGTCAAGAG